MTTAQKMKLFNKDFFTKCDQFCRKLRIWSHFLRKSLMENLIFLCSVLLQVIYLITLVYSIDNCWNYETLLKSSAGQTFYQLLFYWLDRQPKSVVKTLEMCLQFGYKCWKRYKGTHRTILTELFQTAKSR